MDRHRHRLAGLQRWFHRHRLLRTEESRVREEIVARCARNL